MGSVYGIPLIPHLPPQVEPLVHSETYQPDLECIVCYEPVRYGYSRYKCLTCDQSCCRSCFLTWRRRINTCPHCRTSLINTLVTNGDTSLPKMYDIKMCVLLQQPDSVNRLRAILTANTKLQR